MMSKSLPILLLLALACGRREAIDTGAPIIVISIDTLRSDRLPAYGHTSIQTPAIDAFAADSIRFERAYSHSPLTLVSHASVFTGTLPAEHGIRDNVGYRLTSKEKSIAEVLKAKGYATGGAVSSIVLSQASAINRGFDFWEDAIDVDPASIMLGRAQRSGDVTREIAQRWIEEKKSHPFFFFFHIYEPHTPYEPTYDADVVAADAIVGRFLSFLREHDLYDRSTIILMSDHGEGLGDHGEEEHGILLYRESIQVPLLLKLPRSAQKGSSVADPVQLIDVYSTIVGAFDPNQKSDGRSLLDVLRGDVEKDRPIYSETFYPRFHLGWNDLHSVISGEHHYIHARKPELFDVVSDPGETKNILEQRRRTYAALRERIRPFIHAASAPSVVGEEQSRQLAALGYLGSTVAPAADAVLPDPRENIQQIRDIGETFRSFRDQQFEATVAVSSRLLEQNPMMLDLWMMKARALEKLGRFDEGVAAAKEGLRRSPANGTLALIVANLSVSAGRLDDAEAHARLALQGAPAEANYLLAQIALERKDVARARAAAGSLAGEKRWEAARLVILGRAAAHEGNLEVALQHVQNAAAVLESARHQPIPRLHFHRGDVLARMGRADEAAAAFRREIELFPADPQAYKNLVLLYALEGKSREATELIFALEKAAPTAGSYRAIAETLTVLGDVRGARFWAARGLQRFPKDVELQRLAEGRASARKLRPSAG